MGSFFSAPSPVAAPVYVPPAVDNSAADKAAAEAERERKARAALVKGNAEGMAGNVKTSWRGVLEENGMGLKRKQLLGE